MKLAPECMSCLIKQVERAIKLLQPDSPNTLIVKTQHRLMEYISAQDPQSLSSEMMGSITYNFIGEALGMEDPYKQQKGKYNTLALGLYPKIEEHIRTSEYPLKQAIGVSIYGNAIDYGAPIPIDFNEFSQFSNFILSENSDFDILMKTLESAKKILILGDNAGEIVFDKILVKSLNEKYPNKEIIYAVRGGPIINDATMQDAISVGMVNICKVIESSHGPGVVVQDSPQEFQEIFSSTDVILSKGQGNFESIISTHTPNQSVFFLLKAKCELIAKIFQVPQGTLVLQKKTSNLIKRTE